MYLRASKLLFTALIGSALLNGVAYADTSNSLPTTTNDTNQSSNSASPPFSDTEIRDAVKALGEDPNLTTSQKIKTLQWKKKTKEPKPKKEDRKLGNFEWLKTIGEWVGHFFGWITEAGRILVWTIAFILAAVLVVWLLRYVQQRQSGSKKLAAIIPTHVRDLDIRPESLPDDVGAAARTLWGQHAHREALSLLYRGCLSRLVHLHSIAIKHSSTEGECAELARIHLEPHQHLYVATLIRVWQKAVYGGLDPNNEVFEQLCTEFAAALDRPPPSNDDVVVSARA